MGMPKESQFHVLAVDDSLIDRKLIERLLKISSIQVTTVDSGSKALQFLGLHENEQTNPDHPSVSPKSHQEVEVNLIITDYCMPEMTGYELLKKVKESSSLRNIPVVIMSSENVPSRVNSCLEEGAEEFFLKPVRLSDVNKLVPHMMKTITRPKDIIQNQKQDEEEEQQNEEAESQTTEVVQSQEVQVQPQQVQPPINNNNNYNNNIMNYKVIEEGLGVGEDGARHSRYSGLAVA
ncbi:hypothetical protein LguiA_014341 [Lonicera macranthoides]